MLYDYFTKKQFGQLDSIGKIDKYYMSPFRERIVDIITDFWSYRFEDAIKSLWCRSNIIILCTIFLLLGSCLWGTSLHISQNLRPSIKNKSVLARLTRTQKPINMLVWMIVFILLFILKIIVFIIKLCFLIIILPRSLAYVKINPFGRR